MCKRIFSGFVAFTVALGAFVSMPFLMGAVNPNYNENLAWSFDPPAQNAQVFSGRIITVTNSELNANTSGNDFMFAADISSWTKEINTTTTIGGALNMNRFNNFKDANVKDALPYFVSPPSQRQNPNVFILGNNFNENTKSKASFTSQEIELEADGFFVASVSYYAVGGFGAFALVPNDEAPLDDNYVPQIELGQQEWNGANGAVEAQSDWRIAQFFIKTDPLHAQKFSIRLSLGTNIPSLGVIYFQSPQVLQVSEERYNNLYNTANTATKKVVDLSGGLIENYVKADGRSIVMKNDVWVYEEGYDETTAGNFNFVHRPAEKTMQAGAFTTGSFAGRVMSADIPARLNIKEQTQFFLYNASGARNVDFLMISPKTEKPVEWKLDNPFLVRRHQIYMISFYAIGGTAATLRMRDSTWSNDVETAELYTEEKAINMAATTTGTKNGWTLNTFFVSGATGKDMPIDIDFIVQNDAESVGAWLTFDAFDIQRVSNEYYDEHGVEGNTFKIAKNESTSPVANSLMNMGRPASIKNPYPLTPVDWNDNSYAGELNLIRSGIVNTEVSHWNMYNNYGHVLGIPAPINGYSENNNVFMMQNLGLTWQTTQTKPFQLESDRVNIISFYINRQFASNDFNFWITATVKGREVVNLDLSDQHEGWKQYTIAIKESSVTNREVTLKFNLGTADRLSGAGVVFIDNIDVKSIDLDAKMPTNAEYVDLTDSFPFFTGGGFDGLIVKAGEQLEIRNINTEKTVSAKNSLTETLDAGEFYEYRVRAYISPNATATHICEPKITQSIEKGVIKYEREDCADAADHVYGVNFRLDGFEGGFENLKYADIQNMKGLDAEGYAELVFYIRPDNTNELALVVEFGNSTFSYATTVYIKSISLKKITTDDFTLAKESYDKEKAIFDKENKKKKPNQDELKRSAFEHTFMSFITQSWNPEEETNTTPKTRQPFQWHIIVPSLIMGAAVLIALIGFLVRRFKFKLHMDKKYTTYASDDRTSRKK